MREKTREIIAEHVDVTDIKDQFPVYKISEKHLEAVQGIDEPAAQATSIAHATQDHLQPRVDQNPRYKRLSERVNEVVNAWQGGGMGDIEAVETLETLEREAIDIEQGAEDQGMTDGEYAIYTELVDKRDDAIEGDGDAETIARDITESLADGIDTGFEGWKTNQNTLDAIERMVIDVLVKDHDKAALVKADGFLEDARRYLVENHE
jgi:type I restriction enzyme R subunit